MIRKDKWEGKKERKKEREWGKSDTKIYLNK